MTAEINPGLSRRPAVDVKEAREILKTLRQGKPVLRGSHGHIQDRWEAHRVAGLVREGNHSGTETVVVAMPNGDQVETRVKGTVSLNGGNDTLFVPEDSRIINQVFPNPSGRV